MLFLFGRGRKGLEPSARRVPGRKDKITLSEIVSQPTFFVIFTGFYLPYESIGKENPAKLIKKFQAEKLVYSNNSLK